MTKRICPYANRNCSKDCRAYIEFEDGEDACERLFNDFSAIEALEDIVRVMSPYICQECQEGIEEENSSRSLAGGVPSDGS